jgi:hypothetical protein
MVRWGDVELPGFDRALTPVGLARRQALAAHLTDALADVPAPVANATPGNTNPPNFGEACAACRGHCCRKGGNDAYLDFESTALAWGRFPHLSKEELVSAYLAAVPDRAFADSCIFHAEHGCNLPETMRAPVCGAYLCAPLLQLLWREVPHPDLSTAATQRPMVNRALT